MKDVLNLGLRLLIITVIAGLILGGTYVITKDPIAAVSYTHLDVYKRQGIRGALAGAMTDSVQRPRRSNSIG